MTNATLLQSLSEAGEGSRPWWRLPACLLEWCGGLAGGLNAAFAVLWGHVALLWLTADCLASLVGRGEAT